MANLLDRINAGKANQDDVPLLGEVADQITGTCLCPLGDFAAGVVLSSLRRFPNDFDQHVHQLSMESDSDGDS
jgi:NADH:ubiquinone oxidoreductase subunit F (NADH-binding)